MGDYGDGAYGDGTYADSLTPPPPPGIGTYADGLYGDGTYGGALDTGSGGGPPLYTGRLGHPYARPSYIKPGFNLPSAPIRPDRPFPDMMTLVELGRVTALALADHSTSTETRERATSVYPDQ